MRCQTEDGSPSSAQYNTGMLLERCLVAKIRIIVLRCKSYEYSMPEIPDKTNYGISSECVNSIINRREQGSN